VAEFNVYQKVKWSESGRLREKAAVFDDEHSGWLSAWPIGPTTVGPLCSYAARPKGEAGSSERLARTTPGVR